MFKKSLILCVGLLAAVDACSQVTSLLTTTTARVTIGNQLTTPTPPTAVAATCGHSTYYYNSNNPGSGIVGGVNASTNQYPWLARLEIATASATYTCGASIISSSFLITAARCIVSGVVTIRAYFSDSDSNAANTNEFSILVSRVIQHSSYSSTTYDYDLALLQLTTTLNFTASWTVQPICLPSSCDSGCKEGTVAYVAGWGYQNETGLGAANYRFLQTAYVKIANPSECILQYITGTSPISDVKTCAGYPDGTVGPCLGDYGGPLMVMEDGYYKLCGVYSYSNSCAQKNNYAVFTRVCSLISWIKSNAGIA